MTEREKLEYLAEHGKMPNCASVMCAKDCPAFNKFPQSATSKCGSRDEARIWARAKLAEMDAAAAKPECKPLAVGDRVRVYGYSSDGRFINGMCGKVVNLPESQLIACIVSVRNLGRLHFHRYQCRRLRKKVKS